MGQLTIVGLGPGDPGQLTLEAREALGEAAEVYLRTRRHPVVVSLPPGPTLRSFDYLYRRGVSFDRVYEAIADRVVELARRPGGVVYAVPGHPLVGEESVRRILQLARQAELPVRLVPGLSFLDSAFVALRLDPLESGLQIVDATLAASALDGSLGAAGPVTEAPTPARRNPFAGSYRPLEPTRPALLGQVYGKRLASALKLVLLEIYPPEHPATIVQAAGVAGQEKVWTVPLFQLDRQDGIDHLTCVYLPALAPLADLKGFETFRRIVARLRAPDGCPWDREQTRASLKRYLVEESYEVLEALDEGDPGKLCEELGDLLLQIVLHAQLSTEYDEFTLDDVIESIGAKLIRRHPHVFGEVTVADAAEVLRNWDQIKRAERRESGQEPALLAGIPRALPALARAEAIQRRVARTGFDWSGPAGPLAKAREEIAEVEGATTPAERLAELGDLLFAVVGAARHLDVDAEEALRLATLRLGDRFERLEAIRRQRDLSILDLPPDERRRLWAETKVPTGA